MFFHIDESGNTGNNLFDSEQPRLSYGVLSSQRNVDVLCSSIYKKILHDIDDNQIHANKLGIGGLTTIAPHLIQIQKKMKFNFDYYFIEKKDYALVLFFNAVFDFNLNKSVNYELYWTPIRYLLIHKLSILFDEELLKESWRLCIERKIKNFQHDIINLLSKLRQKAINSSLDSSSIEKIVNALNYGIANPLKLDFGYPDPNVISPNAVGFQFIASGIAHRARRKKQKQVFSILVDRQSQFNTAQINTYNNQVKIAESIKKAPHYEKDYYYKHPLFSTLKKDDIVCKGLPDREITISKSADSIGLQIVDVYLWITNKIISGQKIPIELQELWLLFARRSITNNISLEGMSARFSDFEKKLPKE